MAVDSSAVTGHDEDAETTAGRGARGPRLQRVDGPVGPAEPPPPVRLCREWKGLTTADLLRDEIVERLPGQVRSALRHIERGDFAAADRSLPGHETPVLAGPGHQRRQHRGLVVLVAVAAVVAATMVASMFQ